MTILQRAQRIAEQYGTTDPQKILTAMRIKIFPGSHVWDPRYV